MTTTARAFHLATGIVAAGAVVLQFVLVWQGHGVLDESDPPSLSLRIERFFSYFTILSNILVALVTTTQAVRTGPESPVWRVLRINAVVGITVTGMVHWFLLRPLLDLSGVDFVADKLLHMVVPLLAVTGWLVWGPRGRIQPSDLLPSAVFPAAYIVWTLVHGAWRGWYPYPFTDVAELGYPVVVLNGMAVVVLMVALTWGAVLLDRRLADTTAA